MTRPARSTRSGSEKNMNDPERTRACARRRECNRLLGSGRQFLVETLCHVEQLLAELLA